MATVEEIIFRGVDEVSNVAGGIASSLGNIGAIAGGAALAGVTAITGAVVAGIGAFNDWAGQLDSIGDVLGTTANESAALTVAIEGVGGNTQAITGQMAKLTVGLEDAHGKLGPTGKMLQEMGVAFKDANGQMLPATDIIKGVADKVSQMPDGLEKSELMMKLFGKSGKDMTDTLNALTTEGLDKAAQKAKEYGLAIGDDGVNASIEAGKAQKDLELMLKGIGTTIGSQVLPMLLPLAQGFLGFAREALPTVIEGIKGLLQNLQPVIAGVMGFAGTIKDVAGDIADAFGEGGPMAAIEAGVGRIAELFGMSRTDADAFGQGVAAVAQRVGDIIQTMGQIASLAFEGIKSVAEKVWPTVQKIITLIGEIFTTVFGDVKGGSTDMQKTVSDVFAAMQVVIETVMKAIETLLRIVLGVIKGIFKGDWSDIQKIVSDALTALKGLVDEGMAAVKGFIVDRFNEAIAFVEGLPNKFIEFGKGIIEGIAQGIRNGAEAVHQALVQFLKNTLPAWAIQLLGIASPSAVFVPMGYQISAGIAKGIIEGAGTVYDALQKVTTGGVAMKPAMAGQMASNSYNMADTINVYGDMNTAQRIADARREATRQAMLRAAVQG